MATLIDNYSGVENKTSQPIKFKLLGGAYENRQIGHPWRTQDAKAIAESVWGKIDWTNHIAVLATEIDVSAGFNIRFIQLWKTVD